MCAGKRGTFRATVRTLTVAVSAEPSDEIGLCFVSSKNTFAIRRKFKLQVVRVIYLAVITTVPSALLAQFQLRHKSNSKYICTFVIDSSKVSLVIKPSLPALAAAIFDQRMRSCLHDCTGTTHFLVKFRR